MSASSAHRYQFIADQLEDSLDFETMTTTSPLMAIVPQGADRKERLAAAKTLVERRALKTFEGVAAPKGTAVEPSAGDKEASEVVGLAAFYTVKGEVHSLGRGTSAQLREVFEAWVASQS